MTNDYPLVSVIIINLDGKKYLEKCLSSVEKSNYKNLEIILIDNDSKDGSINLVEKNFPQVKIKKLTKNSGFSYPNNIGAKFSKGELLFFLNNDTEIDVDCIVELVKFMKTRSFDYICQSKLLTSDGKIDSSGDFVDSNGIPFNSKKEIDSPIEILSPRGAAFMINRELFLKLGGFDEKFFASFEDVDLGIHARLLGYKIFVIPNSRVIHEGGGTIKKNPKLFQFHGTKNWLIIILTYFDFFTQIKIFWKIFILLIKNQKTKKQYLRENFLPSYRIIIKSILWVLKNFKYIKNKKKIINKSKKVKINYLIEKKLIFRKIE